MRPSSRAHPTRAALHYPALGPYERLRIWENFLNRLEERQDRLIDVGDLQNHWKDWQQVEMDGRHVRNAITTARQYARWKTADKSLVYKHLKDVIEVAGRFDKYIDKVHQGRSQEQGAEDEGLRAG